MTIFLGALAGVLLFGMIGEKENEGKKNFTLGFCVAVVSIVVLEILKLYC